MTEGPLVYVLRAVNGADFNESDIVVVGFTRESAAQQLGNVLKERWENQLDKDDLEFYEVFERYLEGWNEDWTYTRVV